MRLENILALINGKLINEPFVNNFENIIFQAKAVRRGDLFIAFNENDIETAIFNGAYGIIFDKPTQISDSEIAWIKVLNIEDALKRLLRFRSIEKELVVYECNEIILELALQLITEPNFIVLSGDIKSIFQTLWHVQSGAIVLFCPALFDRALFTNIKNLPKIAIEPITIMEQTLFETSFIYDDTFYERQQISPFFIPYLEELLHLLKRLKINYRLRKFISIKHFEPVFVNRRFEVKEFGTSDTVLIFEQNSSLVKPEIKFLQKQASWAKSIYIVPYTSILLDNHKNAYTYKNENEIIDILKMSNFNFALIFGADKSILNKPLANQNQLILEF